MRKRNWYIADTSKGKELVDLSIAINVFKDEKISINIVTNIPERILYLYYNNGYTRDKEFEQIINQILEKENE